MNEGTEDCPDVTSANEPEFPSCQNNEMNEQDRAELLAGQVNTKSIDYFEELKNVH
mgnify:FL=1